MADEIIEEPLEEVIPEPPKSFLQLLNEWPLSRKISLAVVSLISLSVFAIIIFQANVADYRLLYANLSDVNASSVVTWLQERDIPYRLGDNGKSILIPGDKLYDTRLSLAGAGLPRGSGIGFEVFDKQSFGITDFVQKVNYQRALQGELSRTVASLTPVEGARVHLVLPEKRLFKEQQKPATAAVILKLVPGQGLSLAQVRGIIHLVSGSVEGLDEEHVTIVDSNGRVLSQNRSESMQGPMTPGMLDYQQTVERRLEDRAQSMLDRALGPGNSLVKVTAELDFAQIEKVEEIYDPKRSVLRSEQISEEKNDDTGAGGIPGVQGNLTGGALATGGASSSSSSSETANYEVSKVVNRIVAPVGTLKMISVSVLVADKLEMPAVVEEPIVEESDKKGDKDKKKKEKKEEEKEKVEPQPIKVPRSAEELTSIQNMVSSALGLNTDRGDQIRVISMPFEDEYYDDALMTPAKAGFYQYLPFVKYGLISLGALLAYFMFVRPVIKTLRGVSETEIHNKTVEEMEAELQGIDVTVEDEIEVVPDPIELLREEILRANTPPVQVIKSWLREASTP